MKAAVYRTGELPIYADFPEPIAAKPGELLMNVKAVAVKHLDKSRVSGKHYSSEKDNNLRIAGGDGAGVLEDGRRVYAIGSSGMMAEKALVEEDRMVLIPDGLAFNVAAALPNAIMGSAIAFRFRALIKPGETVLINGATGFTGKVAVQVARHYGAGKIIVTGRNEEILQSLHAFGADEMVPLKQSDDALLKQLKDIHAAAPFDIVLDYLWGHSAETILNSLKGNGTFSHKTRFVTIGGMAGDSIQLSSQILRSTDLHISGSGLGSWTKADVQALLTEIVPEMFQLAANGKLKVDIVTMELKDIGTVWDMDVPGGKRLVIMI